MKNKSLLELYKFWRGFYTQQIDGTTPNYDKVFGGMPEFIKEKFCVEYYPEPFYGYIHEDMSNDVLMPLINPGQVDEEFLQKFFGTSSKEETVIKSNFNVKNRHLNWNKDDFLFNEDKEYLGREWRRKKLNQCKKIIGNDISFLHTIEFFPFHSANWNMRKNIKEDWIYSLETTNLFVNAIEEVSRNRLVKHILGVGKDWVTILESYKSKFFMESYEVMTGPKGGRAHSIYKFKPINSINPLPIVIYSGVSMNLPVNDENAVKVLSEFLELKATRLK
jgi:hypothetical protein